MRQGSLSTFLSQIQNSQLVRYILLLTLGWAITQILAYFSSVITVFLFAAILAFLLSYPVQWLAKFIPRNIAAISVFLLSLLVFAGVVVTLGSAIATQVQQLVAEAPQLIDSMINLSQSLQRRFSAWSIPVDFSMIEEQFRLRALEVVDSSLEILQGLLFNLIDIILTIVIAFFLLLDGRRIWQLILKLFPPSIRAKLPDVVTTNLLGFFGGRILLSIFLGCSTFVVFSILDVPFAIALASIAAAFDLVPGIGSTIGIVLISTIVLPHGIGLSLKVLAICIALQQVEENILMPRIMQGSININPAIMFLSLLIGARIAGVIGLFLSIPIAGILISLFELEELRGR